MNVNRSLTLIAFIAIVFVMFPSYARAQMPVEKIRVTVSEPVEVPGLVLPIGSYVFEAVETGTVTRILSADESHIYATFITVPYERKETLNKPSIAIEPGVQGGVERIDSWFFPGESIGNQFVYPKAPSDRSSPSKISSFSSKVGHVTSEAARYSVTVPEYLASHVERAVVHSGIATEHFFGSRFLVA